jgi:hypothetical protein
MKIPIIEQVTANIMDVSTERAMYGCVKFEKKLTSESQNVVVIIRPQ